MVTVCSVMISHFIDVEFEASFCPVVIDGVDVCLDCFDISCESNVVHETNLH